MFARILLIVLLSVMIVFLGFAIANCVYFHKIETSSEPNPSVSTGTARTMFIINVIMIIAIVIFIIVIIVCLARSSGGKEKKKEKKKEEEE